MDDSGKWVKAAAADLAPGEMQAVEVGRVSLAIYHLDDGSWHATDNECTHAFAMLTDGWLEGSEIECPLHAGRFDVKTGRGLCPPIDQPLRTYPVRIEDGSVMVQLDG